jgi:hypothetical protein
MVAGLSEIRRGKGRAKPHRNCQLIRNRVPADGYRLLAQALSARRLSGPVGVCPRRGTRTRRRLHPVRTHALSWMIFTIS